MISTKGRYGLRIMLDLAEHSGGDFVPLKDMAARQGISKKYLEIIAKELVKGKLLASCGGRCGVYRLCRRPEEYTVGEILELLEGPLAPVACLVPGAAPCGRADGCRTLPLWAEFDRMMHDYFYGKTLADLI